MANPLAQVTLVADTVSTQTLDGDYNRVEVLSVDGASAVYFTIGGATPTVGGASCFVLPAAIGALEVDLTTDASSAAVIKLISSGTPKVSVRGVN